jgi:hypothetical protein
MSPLDRQGNYYADEVLRADAAVASAARTTTATGTAFNVDNAESFEAFLSITAASGTTPTLDVVLETTVNGVDWYEVDAFAQKTGVDEDARAFGPLGDQARWKWTIGGTDTPTFTFSIAVDEKT